MAPSVLLIEDSRSMRALVTGALGELGAIRVVEVDNGFAALKALPGSRFDLIITDINLPEITGLEIVRFVKEHPQYRHIPVLIISTQRSADDIQRGMTLGASAYLGKPFEPEQLKATVRTLLPASPAGG
jgi:two-component system chemotaxis response regulator CheY